MLIKMNDYRYQFFDENNPTEQPIGSFDLFEHKDTPSRPMYLWSFGIRDEENHFKGYGQRMLREAIAVANGKPIRLYVMRNNDVAIHVYEKFGFKIIGSYMGEMAWTMQHDGNVVNKEEECAVAC